MTTEKGRLEQADEVSKKAYATPRFTCYGSLSELTRGGTFIGNDGNTKCSGQSSAGDPSCVPS